MFQAIVVFLHKGAITEVILVAIQFSWRCQILDECTSSFTEIICTFENRDARFDARSVVNLYGFVVSTQSYNHNSLINCILCYVFVLSRSFGENAIFSKAVRQNPEQKAWVWGYVWPPLRWLHLFWQQNIP